MTSQSLTTPPGTRTGYDWTARIRCVVAEVGTNVRVHLFLGPIPEPPAGLMTSPNYVGSFYTYYDKLYYSIAEKRRGKPVQGFVGLSRDLVKHGGLQTSEPENAVPYLKSNLTWCVQKIAPGGERVDLHDMPSLEVMVLEVPLTLSSGESVPDIGPPKEHPDITRGKEGGAK
ncbi:hypothetical protein FRC04_001933 [Tulasnella sp. 424]|nr:hypothetical protein FRC04_001933 [Tulasnella sp. 424]KAG8977710.1 hypothetical protein FRC05_000966 [Tulasnella sp. 425]